MFLFLLIVYVPQIHIIDMSLVVYSYLLSFIANLGEKLHLTSGMNMTILLTWYQTIHNFRAFFSYDRMRMLLFCISRLFCTYFTHQRLVIRLKFPKVSSLGDFKKC